MGIGASSSARQRTFYTGNAAARPPPVPGGSFAGTTGIVPNDSGPWVGPQVQYSLMNVNVQMHSDFQFSWAPRIPVVTSNVDSYYPQLAQMYAQGLELISFYRIPGAQQARGLFNMGVTVAYQGIFVRSSHSESSTEPRYQLRIEKSVMQTQRVYTGLLTPSFQQSNTEDIHQKIVANTQNGCRLVCIELTGSSKSQGRRAINTGPQKVQGVDVFFHVPVTPGAPNYSVQCASVPIPMRMSISFGGSNVQFNIDWNATMNEYLNQGWKLIEIFLDQAQTTAQGGFMTPSITLHSVWFFEKETALLEDPCPRYQGCVVPYQHRIQAGFRGTTAQGNWAPLLEQMGQRGWELACILETPGVQMSGLMSMSMNLLFFFQRPIYYTEGDAAAPPEPVLPSRNKKSDDPPPTVGPGVEPPPPSYEDAIAAQGTSR